MTWKEDIREELIRYKEEKEQRQFRLHDFYDYSEQRLASKHPRNNHVRAKIRQVLQQLRDADEIKFVDDAGTYHANAVEDSDESQQQDTNKKSMEIGILEQMEDEFEDI